LKDPLRNDSREHPARENGGEERGGKKTQKRTENRDPEGIQGEQQSRRHTFQHVVGNRRRERERWFCSSVHVLGVLRRGGKGDGQTQQIIASGTGTNPFS
jgi:hypothetical protein